MPDPGIGAGAAAGLLEPVEHLGGRVDLVVVLTLWENRQLVDVLGEPRGLLGQMDKAVLDHRGLRMHAHDLVRLRLIAGDGMQAFLDQLLDQLGAGSFVLDQHHTRREGLALLAHRALQLGRFHAPAQDIEQIEVLALDPPGRADAEIAELARLVGGVPALHDAVELVGPLVWRVIPKPRGLGHAAARGAGICWYWPADLLEGRHWLALGVQCLAALPDKGVAAPTRYRADRPSEVDSGALQERPRTARLRRKRLLVTNQPRIARI